MHVFFFNFENEPKKKKERKERGDNKWKIKEIVFCNEKKN